MTIAATNIRRSRGLDVDQAPVDQVLYAIVEVFRRLHLPLLVKVDDLETRTRYLFVSLLLPTIFRRTLIFVRPVIGSVPTHPNHPLRIALQRIGVW